MLLALLLGLVTTLAIILGAYLAVARQNPSKRLLTNFIGFGAGFLLGAAFLEMGPEAMKRGVYMPAFIALGYLLVFLGEHLFGIHLHRLPGDNGDAHNHVHDQGGAHVGAHSSERAAWISKANLGGPALVAAAAGVAAPIAFHIHDFMDGLAIGAAMVENQRLGILVFLAVLIHEIPVGFTLAAVIQGAGVKRKVAFLAGVSIGLITLVGIPIPFLVGTGHPAVTGAFLALATGTFIYVGASLLVPVVETGGFRWSFLWVIIGFIVFYATVKVGDALGAVL